MIREKQVAEWRGRGLARYRCVALLLILHGAVNPALGQGQKAVFTAELPAIDDEELQNLTTSQQKARQLATLLIGNREDGVVVKQKTLLGSMTSQTIRLGTRGGVVIFNTPHVKTLLLGGRQVLTSAIDYKPLDMSEDAQRPLFLPPSEDMISMEIIAK